MLSNDYVLKNVLTKLNRKNARKNQLRDHNWTQRTAVFEKNQNSQLAKEINQMQLTIQFIQLQMKYSQKWQRAMWMTTAEKMVTEVSPCCIKYNYLNSAWVQVKEEEERTVLTIDWLRHNLLYYWWRSSIAAVGWLICQDCSAHWTLSQHLVSSLPSSPHTSCLVTLHEYDGSSHILVLRSAFLSSQTSWM